MSAPAPNGTGPGRPPVFFARKKAPVSCFAPRKKPVQPVAPGQKPPGLGSQPTKDPAPPRPPANQTKPVASTIAAPAPPHPAQYQDYDIIIQKSASDEGLRHHVLKFHTKLDETRQPIVVDPYNSQHFERPLLLHRRFATDKAQTAEPVQGKEEDNKELEILTARHAARVAEREENQKLIAPSGSADPQKLVRKKPQKKVEEGRDDTNPERIKRQLLRYEESRPWHLEDADGKNVWAGSYQQPLSEQSVMFVVTGQGFSMVPIEKWYKFTQSTNVKALSSEEIERRMNQKFKLPSWARGTQFAAASEREEKKQVMQQQALARRREQEDEDDLFGEKNRDGEYQVDKDGLDMDIGDLADFQDDDEGALYMNGEGEDAKEIEARIREEMRNAGLGGTGLRDDAFDPEQEYQKEVWARAEEAKKSKKMRKRLKKRENKLEYESDSNDDGVDPYASSSESEDSDEERERLEEEAKQEEARKATLSNDQKSGASSKGTNTPSGRLEKKDPLRLNGSLGKRPGSPDVSDMSGNESSRKKAKTLSGRAVSTTGPARSLSPEAAKLARAAGSGSGSDTDTSRAGRVNGKIRLKSGVTSSQAGRSPGASRAGSPSAPDRVPTPKSNGASVGAPPPPRKDFPTLEEIKAAIPANGVDIKALVAMFKSKVGVRTGEFIKLVKAVGTQDKATGKIMPKMEVGGS